MEDKTAAAAHTLEPVGSHSSIDKKEVHVGLETTQKQGEATFYETISASPLNPWSRTSFQLYGILLVAALNATASGFDGVSNVEECPAEEVADTSRRWYSPYSVLSMPCHNTLTISITKN